MGHAVRGHQDGGRPGGSAARGDAAGANTVQQHHSGAGHRAAAYAYIEEDGIALCIALVAALVSLAIVAATVWAALRGIDFLDRL